MTGKNHIALQKTGAAFFILLLLFVNAVKFFHHHPPSSPNTTGLHYSMDRAVTVTDLHEAKLVHHCAICDYQLVKETWPPGSLEFTLLTHSYPLHTTFPLCEQLLTRNPASDADRGPPSSIA